MLTEEYAELFGARPVASSESARWALEDVAFWETDYADSTVQERIRDTIRRSRPDGGLRTRPREQHIFRHLRPHLKGKLLLDVGCGSAQTVQIACHPETVGYSYVGVDLSLSALLTNQKTFPGLFVQASATDLPFQPDTFDAILLLGTLHHVYDPKRTLRRILELLKPGGLIGLHEVTYRRGHRGRESKHNDYVPLNVILETLRETCALVDVKREHTPLRHLVAPRLAEPMRTRPTLTKGVLALDTIAEPLRYLHPSLGPRAVLVTARKLP